MPAERLTAAERQRRIRDLRLRIARQRQRIERRTRSVSQSRRQVFSWRPYAQRFPGVAAAGAFGLGLLLAGGVGRRWIARWVGMRLVRQASKHFGETAWSQMARVWQDSRPSTVDANNTEVSSPASSSGPAQGGDDAGA